jgi:hypothetical protein
MIRTETAEKKKAEDGLQLGHAHTPLKDLPQLFRDHALLLRKYGAEAHAVALEQAAVEVEDALVGHLEERLSLEGVATESGYTIGHLRRLVREGKLRGEADGTILRRHLPIKPGADIARQATSTPTSRSQLARAVAGGQ